MRDYMNGIQVLRAISPQAARTDNTPIVGVIIPNTGFNGLVYAINIGADTDTNATFAVTMDHGDDPGLTDAVPVPASALTGTLALAGFNFADDNETRKIGYVGSKAYTRLTITPSGNDSGNIFVDALALLFGSRYAPTPNPPV